MPEGTKVGDVYVEGRLEYDEKNTPAFFAAMQRDVRRRLPDVTNSIRQHFNTEMTKTGESAGSALSRSLQTSLNRLNLRLPKLDVPVDDALRDLNRVQGELQAIARSRPTAQVTVDTAQAMAEVQRLRTAIESSRAKIHLEVETDPIKNSIKTALAQAFKPDPAVTTELVEMLRFGVSRGLVGIFTSPAGAAIGAALVAALGQAIVAGTVFLGAALTGAIIGGLGLAAIAGGIALVADDPKIKAAGDKIGDKLMSGLKKAAEPFRQEVLESLGILSGTIDKIMPRIQTIFADLSQHVVPLTQAVDKFVTSAMPGLQSLLTNLDPVIGSLTQGIERLGVKIGEAFKILSDPQAIQGAAVALEDLMGILGELIVLAARFMATLSQAWLDLRPLLIELREALKGIGIDGDFVADTLSLLGTILMVNLAGGIIMVTNIAKGLAAVFREVRDAWRDFRIDIDPAIDAISLAFHDLKEDGKVAFAELKAAWQDFRNDIQPGINELRAAWKDFRDDINAHVVPEIKAAWQDFKNDFTTVVVPAIKAAWQDLRNDMNTGASEIRTAWHDLQSDSSTVWGAIRQAWSDLRGDLNNLRADIRTSVEDIKATWRSLRDEINGIVASIKQAWSDLRADVDSLRRDINSSVEDIKGVWRGLRDDINGIVAEIKRAWTDLRNDIDALRRKFDELRDTVRTTWNENLSNIRTAWGQIRDTIFNEINSRIEDLKARFQQLKDAITARFNESRDTIRNVWTEIRTQIFEPMGDMIANQIPAKYEEFKQKVIRIFSEVRDTIGRIWTEMISAAKTAVNTLGGFINNVIRAINKIPFMKDKLPELPGFADGGAVPGKARGGPIEGGPRGTDTVPAMGRWGQPFLLDNGEHVLTKHDVAAMGGHQVVYKFRKALHNSKFPEKFGFGGPIRKMAAGGRVDAGNNQLLEEHRNHVHVAMNVPPMGFPAIIAAAKASGIPHSVGSTFRPGSRGSGGGLDHHSEGRAVDFPGFNQDRFAAFWEGLPGVIELIHRTNTRDYAIFGGKGGGGVSGVISWLLSEAGKAVKAAFDKAMGELKGFIGGDLLKGDNVAPGVMRNMFTSVADQLSSFFDFNASAGGGGAAAAPEQLKKWIEEAQKYVTIEDVGRLLTLIMRESGGNPRAINLTDSNAQKGTPSKGLMQTIDPTFQAYRDKRLPNDPFDPVANIVAGMNYIHARYGSLMNVQQANANAAPRGYEHGGEISAVRVAMDRAGVIPSGSEAFIKNATSETEFALTASHMQKLFGRDDPYASDAGSTVNVYVDGVRRDARIEVQKNAKKVAGALRAGGRA